MERDRHNFLSFWTIFLHFYPLNNPKNQNFEKIKKPPGDIITLHMCTINDNHMWHGSWDIECDGHNVLSSWTVFCLFTPLTTQKIKILEKWGKQLEILSFYTSVPYRIFSNKHPLSFKCPSPINAQYTPKNILQTPLY